jgi:hypothetical protein
MGFLLSKAPVQELELPACMIYQVNDDHVVYLPNHILYFDGTIKEICGKILGVVKKDNSSAKIYYDEMTIYGIGIVGSPSTDISPKLCPTTFGYVLEDDFENRR